ncbi:RNA-directed DNA polymerase [Limobrevibacterium gyesilva]|uniref:RNA-directed DNA polymerase n=1 Tax=Limobrevibacterium gyesilva TaxID=2991712 RepID=A0AA42CEU1_9PROT|nr:RNA-directed DNA polymerase [Limobrevibacterium gyesilva]MCW3475714.1 RNA-directed DNA polymerase [Limobrevibacterium gyesilva]
MAKQTMKGHARLALTLRNLLKSHYLADDFPPTITTGRFADYCMHHHASFESLETMLKRTTVYGRFSAPRTITTRRVLALPHPANQLALSLILAKEQADIRKTIKKSPLTLYRTVPSSERSRAFKGLDFRARTKRETEILARYPVVLITDIANFFHTIYSHSLPWAVLKKERVKAAIEKKGEEYNKLEQHWSNRLDKALQRGNSRETFGIPVGPDTSRIIAEILLSGVHDDAYFSSSIKDSSGYRLVDDFFIGFKTEDAARRCLDALRRVLWEYNLHLNEGKTRIVRSSLIFGEEWRHEMENFVVESGSRSRQQTSIERFLDVTLRLCNTRQDAQAAAFFCRRLLTIDIASQNLPLIRDCLLRMGRDFTTCLKFVFQFVISNLSFCQTSGSKKLFAAWIQQILETHSSRGHDLEVSWMLILCGVLGIRVDQNFMALNDRTVSPVVLSMLGLLSADGLLAERWDDWQPTDHGTASVENGRNWLPYYEAVRRNWTTNTEIISPIRGDPLFSKLLKWDVTFLDNVDFFSQTSARSKPARPPRPSGGTRNLPSRLRRFLSGEDYE